MNSVIICNYRQVNYVFHKTHEHNFHCVSHLHLPHEWKKGIQLTHFCGKYCLFPMNCKFIPISVTIPLAIYLHSNKRGYFINIMGAYCLSIQARALSIADIVFDAIFRMRIYNSPNNKKMTLSRQLETIVALKK